MICIDNNNLIFKHTVFDFIIHDSYCYDNFVKEQLKYKIEVKLWNYCEYIPWIDEHCGKWSLQMKYNHMTDIVGYFSFDDEIDAFSFKMKWL